MPQHSAEWFRERLEGVEGTESQFSAWCPCHDDIGTSRKGLSGTVTSSGKVLLKCHSCDATIAEIARALEGENPYSSSNGNGNGFHPNVHKISNGRRTVDSEVTTEPKGSGLKWWAEKTGVPESTWDNLGVLEYQDGVVFPCDGFTKTKVRRPKGTEHSWIGKGARPMLWPTPEDELPEEIWICEGESDTGTMRHVGHHAFSLLAGAGQGGEGGKYLTVRYFKALMARGAERIVIAGDDDPAGVEMTSTLADTATEAGLDVSVLRLDLVLDPIGGLNDLNGMWREAGPKKFGELLHRAVHKVSSGIPTITLEESMEIADTDVDWIIPELVAPGDKIMIAGPQKSYKTWIGLDLVRSMVAGKPFLNRGSEWTPNRTVRKALFVQEEGNRQLWARRLRRLKMPDGTPLLTLHRWFFRFTDPMRVAQLVDLCRREEVELLVLDPLQRMIPGVDENSSAEVGVVWDTVQKIQEVCPGIVVVIIHHANKTERLSFESVRGSSRHAGEVDFGIFVERNPNMEHSVRVAVDGRDIPQYLGTGQSFEVKVRISDVNEEDYYAEFDGQEIALHVPNTGQVIGHNNRNQILQAIQNGESTIAEIMEAVNRSDATVRRHLGKLITEGVIEEVDNGEGNPKEYIPKEVDDGD